VRSPVSPRQSLQHIVVPAGLKVELVAHEPNVIDPVAMRFDEDGRMWVVEMRDYPTASTKGIVARSRISILTDRDGDGFFESASVFADELPYATGVQPWKGGVFVTMAGQVAYMKDTDGDDRADVVEAWYTGFAEKNTQLRANHPRLALDNHVYVANGLRGGQILDARDPHAAPVSISGMDFRFDPITRKFEGVSGAGQFGLTFDDYANRFVCSNRNPAMHVVLEDRHLKKNPLVAVSAVTTDVAKAAGESRLFPIGRSWTTSHLHAGQFTAACGVEVYRGDALPREFYGNLFVCDPTAHVVHREIVKPSGVTFASQPAEEGVEFFASRDDWCSPVNLEVGPDGALYVVDMYRAVIEHPHWMPAELRERPDLVEGNDRGRIYRVIPRSLASRAARAGLKSRSSQALVELLAHPNAWWRETAARLLFERQDKRVGMQLERMALEHPSQAARIHALRLLDGLQLLQDELIVRLLRDADPRVVEQAAIVAEPRVSTSRELQAAIWQLVDHRDARVRFQTLLAATPLPSAPVYPADRWELDAVLIAAGKRGGAVLASMLQHPATLEANVGDPKRFIAELARLAAAASDAREQSVALDAMLASPAYVRVGLCGFFDEAASRGQSLADLQAQLSASARRKLANVFAEAAADAAHAGLPAAARCEAIDLLAFSEHPVGALLPLALDESDQPVRVRAISALGKIQATEPWKELLSRYGSETPAIQRAILDGVFASARRTSLLLDEIAAGRIKATELDANHAKLLLSHGDAAIQARAKELLSEALPPDREQALAQYQAVLQLKADPLRGRAVFEKQCATCHQIDGVGVEVAPDISDSREKAPAQLLTDIIQPNRAIDSNYFSFTAITADGLVHSGVLAAETSTSVTLKQADGKSVTLHRNEIEELHSDGVSFMPDGLEKNIPPQDMANLIGFIKNWRYLKSPDRPAANP
jgi:putative membrane-bound dehydrogenase-like protein